MNSHLLNSPLPPLPLPAHIVPTPYGDRKLYSIDQMYEYAREQLREAEKFINEQAQ